MQGQQTKGLWCWSRELSILLSFFYVDSDSEYVLNSLSSHEVMYPSHSAAMTHILGTSSTPHPPRSCEQPKLSF